MEEAIAVQEAARSAQALAAAVQHEHFTAEQEQSPAVFEPEPAAEAEPESDAEAELKPAAEAEPEPAAEVEPEPTAEAAPEAQQAPLNYPSSTAVAEGQGTDDLPPVCAPPGPASQPVTYKNGSMSLVCLGRQLRHHISAWYLLGETSRFYI